MRDWPRDNRTVTVVALVLALVVVPLVVLAVTNGVFVSGTVPLQAPGGPQVDVITGAENDMDLTDPFPDSNTVDVVTDDGEATFSSQGAAEATVASGDLEGGTTTVTGLDVSANALTVDPGDKGAVTVSGGASELSFSDPRVDDGDTDFSYTSTGQTSLTIQGLPENEVIRAVSSGGDLLQTAGSGGSGEATFDALPDGDYEVELISGQVDPDLSNPSPRGDLSNAPSRFEVNVSDDDFPLDELDVSFYLEGSFVDNTTATQAGRVNVSIPDSGLTAGRHTWTVEAEDSFGETASLTSSYRVPDYIEIRNESNPDELINEQADVRMTFFADDSVVDVNTTDGRVNMTDLPVNQDINVEVDAPGYHRRYLHVNSIYEQQTVYMLSENVSSVDVRFTLTDTTGQFPRRTNLFISRPITQNGTTEYRTIYADEFGAEGVTTALAEGVRYRLRIQAPDGKTQDMGVYRADTSETVELRPSGPAVEFERDVEGWGVSANLDSENQRLTYHYDDPDGLTDSVVVTIFERSNESNTLLDSQGYYGTQTIDGQEALTEAQTDVAWVVEFEITRDGETFTKRVDVTARGDLVPPELDDGWRHVIGVGLLLLSGGAFSVLNRKVGAVIIGIEGGILWWTGFLDGATIGAAIAIYLFLVAAYLIRNRGRP